jgi:heme-degrading monooxygenase HmoA
MNSFANTPKPPYYAVIFTSVKISEDMGYSKMSKRMLELLSRQEGFLGFESAREELGITVSYWDSLDSIKKWKSNLEHKEAQRKGREIWYKEYKIRIAKVERDYDFKKL